MLQTFGPPRGRLEAHKSLMGFDWGSSHMQVFLSQQSTPSMGLIIVKRNDMEWLDYILSNIEGVASEMNM